MKSKQALLLAAFTIAAFSPLCRAGTNVDGTITFASISHDYILHIPTNFASGKAMPLIVSLHGYLSNPDPEMSVDKLWSTADTAGYLVVYPHGWNDSWDSGPYCCGNNTNDDVGLMRALVDTIAAHYSIDPNRVYASGFSNGAMMSNRLGAEAADVFAAVVGASGPLAISHTDAEIHPSRLISVMDFHSLDDQTVPYAGGYGGGAPAETVAVAQWASVNGCDIGPATTTVNSKTTLKAWKKTNSPVEVMLYTAADGGHYWPPSYVPADSIIIAFFRRHSLNEGTTSTALPGLAVNIGCKKAVVRSEYFSLDGHRLALGNNPTCSRRNGIVIKRDTDADGQIHSVRVSP